MITIREQFEAECRNGLINGGLAKHENGKYASELTYAVWRGWQASREAVEIQLPDHRDYEETLSDHELGFNTGLEQCAEAILAAGIKVK